MVRRPNFWKQNGVSGDISIEGSALQEAHNQSVWDSVLKQVGNVKAGQGAHHVEGAYLASHRGVLGQLWLCVSFFTDVLEHLFIQTELTQMKLQLDVPSSKRPANPTPFKNKLGLLK